MTEDTNLSAPNPNDRIMAALAHITVIMPLWGLIVPIIIWVTQKEKSSFVVFQAIQAVAFQLVLIIAYFLGMLFYICSFFSTFIFLPFGGMNNTGFPMAMVIPLAVIGCIFLGYLVFLVYGIAATVLVFQGKDFRYILIGSWLERYLSQEKVQAI